MSRNREQNNNIFGYLPTMCCLSPCQLGVLNERSNNQYRCCIDVFECIFKVVIKLFVSIGEAINLLESQN